ncbi:MAG: esterase/lipase family protein [Terriglobales bacterium]
MADPTRPLPNLVPQPDGSWIGHTVLTPTALKTRGLFTLPSSKVVPVIVVPGIMGTNLRAAKKPGEQPNSILKPGDKAWRPPNGPGESIMAVYEWRNRNAGVRQKILDGKTLEVDDGGDIHLSPDARNYGTTESEVRERYWGEVYWDSYGKLLFNLQVRLNHTFETDALDNVRVVCRHWRDVIACDPALWGVRTIKKITEKELEKHAGYYYPVYACGYNWLESCEESANRLRDRIEKTIAFWTQRKRECNKVIVVTHSMGGLVARACAKQIPDRILGVIHGVMPALGAPVCYRRIACGTEGSSPSNGKGANAISGYSAEIFGNRPELTMPVMSTSPGPLELLPNHIYPQRWLQVGMRSRVNNKDVTRDLVHLPTGNPYDLYRDTKSWYRLIDINFVDPAKHYLGGQSEIASVVRTAIEQAERFHREVLDTYYHPNTYAFYGADWDHMSFGTVQWVARDPGTGAVFTEANLRGATLAGPPETVGRRIKVEGKTILDFAPADQDAKGDGTVPSQSGAGPLGKVRQLFEIRGLDHQDAFNNEAVQLLTQHLVVKLVQELP